MAITLKENVLPWLDRIDSMELRERILLLAAVIVVMFLLVDTLILQPLLTQQQITRQHIEDLDVKLNGLRQHALLLNYKSNNDPAISHRQSRGRLTSELSDLDDRIIGQLDALVEPEQATQILEQILHKHHGLKLASLNTSIEPLADLSKEQPSDIPGLIRYQFDMVIQGGYQDVLSYLKRLEAMPWKFFWQQIDFKSTQYPYAETRLRLYILGTQDA